MSCPAQWGTLARAPTPPHPTLPHPPLPLRVCTLLPGANRRRSRDRGAARTSGARSAGGGSGRRSRRGRGFFRVLPGAGSPAQPGPGWRPAGVAAAEAAVAEALATQARVRSVETRWRRRSGAWPPPPPPRRSPPHRLPPPPPSSPPPPRAAAAPASAAAPGRSPGAREGARPGLGRAGDEAEAGARAGTTTAAAATPGGDGVADAADPPAGGVGRAQRRLVLRPAPGHLRERAPPLPVALSARPALHALHGEWRRGRAAVASGGGTSGVRGSRPCPPGVRRSGRRMDSPLPRPALRPGFPLFSAPPSRRSPAGSRFLTRRVCVNCARGLPWGSLVLLGLGLPFLPHSPGHPQPHLGPGGAQPGGGRARSAWSRVAGCPGSHSLLWPGEGWDPERARASAHRSSVGCGFHSVQPHDEGR